MIQLRIKLQMCKIRACFDSTDITYYMLSAFTNSSPLLFSQGMSHMLDLWKMEKEVQIAHNPTQKSLSTKILLSYISQSWARTKW